MRTATLVLMLAAGNSAVAVAQARPQSAAAATPLCIVDGIRTDCAFLRNTADSAMIESVEVIKGPGAASKYGPDAADGVILVKTRGGGRAARLLRDDPLGSSFFGPELVMAHQQEIGLSDRQRAAIQAAMKEAQNRFVDLQFRLNLETEKLQRLVDPPAPDEAKAIAQLERVLDVEREVKRVQLALMVRIKGELTESQQATLRKSRR